MSQKYEMGIGPPLNTRNQMSIQKLSTGERDALTASEKFTGMLIYNTTTGTYQTWNGTVWKEWGE